MDRVVAEDGAPVMLSPSIATRIFVALEPVDMRQNFNGLYARVQTVLQQDPLSGHFFVFTNRSRTRLRLLVWDGVPRRWDGVAGCSSVIHRPGGAAR